MSAYDRNETSEVAIHVRKAAEQPSSNAIVKIDGRVFFLVSRVPLPRHGHAELYP